MLADTIRCDFDAVAPEPADRIEPVARRLVAEVAMRSRVLEIGCGTGALARVIARRGANVTAVDRSPELIALARSRTPSHLGIEYRVAELHRLAPRGFDLVIAHALPAPEALERLAAAVRPGGSVVVIDRYRAWWSRAPELTPLSEVRSLVRTLLPGCVVRRHLGGRCSLRWSKPR